MGESGRPGPRVQWARGREGRGEVTRAISSHRLSLTSHPLGATTLNKQDKKERNAETPLQQRVLPAQRGALQRGGPHPLRRLLHLRPSAPCTRPSTSPSTPCSERPPQPDLYHHLH